MEENAPQRVSSWPHLVFSFKILSPHRLFFSSPFQALGFTESDSAGQTNIFAVEPKAYVAGSSNDKTSDAGSSTAGAAAIAGTFAVGAVVGGLLLVKDVAPILENYPTEYLTLAEYKSEFTAEFSSVAAPSPSINES